MVEPGNRELADIDVAAAEESDQSLIDDVRNLADDTRTAVEAEIAYQSARAKLAGLELRSIVLWGVLAALFGFVALLTMAIGVVLALMPVFGGIGATFFVVFILALGAAAAGMVARQGMRGLQKAIAGENPREVP